MFISKCNAKFILDYLFIYTNFYRIIINIIYLFIRCQKLVE